MRDAMEFEMLLDDVLREIANPEPETGLMQRVMLRMEMAAVSEKYETAQGGFFEGELKQEGLFRSIWNGLREMFSPSVATPLVLESRPVAMVDRMMVRRSYRATGWAVVAHVFAIIVIGYAATTRIPIARPVDLKATALADPPAESAEGSRDGWGWWTAGADSGDEGNASEVCSGADCSAEGSAFE